jgi:hypothetical protein
MEVKVNFRSVMPLDALGDARVTIFQKEGNLESSGRVWKQIFLGIHCAFLKRMANPFEFGRNYLG